MTEVFALPETLSPSGTGTFQNCPLQFRFQNIQKLPQPPGAAAVKGNVVHRALELLFQLDAPLRTHAAAHDFLATAKTEFEPTYLLHTCSELLLYTHRLGDNVFWGISICSIRLLLSDVK